MMQGGQPGFCWLFLVAPELPALAGWRRWTKQRDGGEFSLGGTTSTQASKKAADRWLLVCTS